MTQRCQNFKEHGYRCTNDATVTIRRVKRTKQSTHRHICNDCLLAMVKYLNDAIVVERVAA